MIQIENFAESGAEAAIRGMRNPMNSWEKSDTVFDPEKAGGIGKLGRNDSELMLKLCAEGPEHRKFMRMMTVTMDITAPLYWWKEMDTYKVGTVCDSCSTMHKIHAKPFIPGDFSYEHMSWRSLTVLLKTIDVLNIERGNFNASKDKDCWWQMIQLLPSSYNQRRTMQFNYEVLRNIYWQRRDHKLDEWRDFCKVITTVLRYPKLITSSEM